METIRQEDYDSGNGLNDGDVVLVQSVGGGIEQKTYDKYVSIVRHITPDALQDRFYFEEKVLIVGSADPRVKAFYDDLRFRKRMVDLDSPRFRLAMDLLLELNIIEQGRDLELLQDGQPHGQV